MEEQNQQGHNGRASLHSCLLPKGTEVVGREQGLIRGNHPGVQDANDGGPC